MHYLVYKITNNVNHRVYIGCHQTENIHDNYMGSGRILREDYKKYGTKDFTKEILYVFESKDMMFQKEKDLVNDKFVADKNTYNLVTGGQRGKMEWTTEQRAHRSKISKQYWKNLTVDEYNKICADRREIGNRPEVIARRRHPGKLNGMYGKTHTSEVKAKLRRLAKDRFKGKTYEEIYGKEKADQLKKSRSKSMKAIRKLNPVNGSKNPNAKTYKFTCPDGVDYIVSGNLRSFCKEQGLGIDNVINIAKGRRSEYKGWAVTYI